MDAITLDHLLAEFRPLLLGRHLRRPQIVAAQALAFEVSGEHDLRLWLDVGRRTAGLYLLDREELRAIADRDISPHATKQALLLARKHLAGRRLTGLTRVPGERTLVLEAGSALLALRIAPSPALTLVVDGVELSSIGGSSAWPLPEAHPEREWNALEVSVLEAQTDARGILKACPSLGRVLAREIASSEWSLRMREKLASPRPVLFTPRRVDDCEDADLVPAEVVSLLPIAVGAGVALEAGSWRDAAARFLSLRSRGIRFEERRREALAGVRREARRLSQLVEHLSQDRLGLSDPVHLRRQGEALLAFPESVRAGESEASVPDPYDEERRLLVHLDPELGGVGNAERLFRRARRIERAHAHLERRLADAQASLALAQARETSLLDSRDLSTLPPKAVGSAPRASQKRSLHYLTSSGLSILVGRGARENHHLTFEIARPDDFWLHARDVPGAHVILRDNDGRAGAGDLREAAEVAAFFSGAQGEAQADVHLARRKHVRPGAGSGRALVAQSETLRVAPRDPEGRLRKR
jgi:hypothetical protein